MWVFAGLKLDWLMWVGFFTGYWSEEATLVRVPFEKAWVFEGPDIF
jgi:hypothetical protein